MSLVICKLCAFSYLLPFFCILFLFPPRSFAVFCRRSSAIAVDGSAASSRTLIAFHADGGLLKVSIDAVPKKHTTSRMILRWVIQQPWVDPTSVDLPEVVSALASQLSHVPSMPAQRRMPGHSRRSSSSIPVQQDAAHFIEAAGSKVDEALDDIDAIVKAAMIAKDGSMAGLFSLPGGVDASEVTF